MLVNVKIDSEKIVDILLDRLMHWIETDDIITYKLYEQMYTKYAENYAFDSIEFDLMVIVDNDYINYCKIISKGDDEYEEVKKIFETQGLGDCSCEHKYISFIEAEYANNFLVRFNMPI